MPKEKWECTWRWGTTLGGMGSGFIRQAQSTPGEGAVKPRAECHERSASHAPRPPARRAPGAVSDDASSMANGGYAVRSSGAGRRRRTTTVLAVVSVNDDPPPP